VLECFILCLMLLASAAAFAEFNVSWNMRRCLHKHPWRRSMGGTAKALRMTCFVLLGFSCLLMLAGTLLINQIVRVLLLSGMDMKLIEQLAKFYAGIRERVDTPRLALIGLYVLLTEAAFFLECRLSAAARKLEL
jgi:hypothetical protein